MSVHCEEPSFDFDLDFLNHTPNKPVVSDKRSRKAILIVKKKIVATDSLIRRYYEKRDEVEQLERGLQISKDECKQTCLDFRTLAEKCSLIEKETESLRHSNAALEEKYTVSENLVQAIQSHANQLQTLVKEKETTINTLTIENQLLKTNALAVDEKKFKSLQKENEDLKKDIFLMRAIILGKKKLNKQSRKVLHKYENCYVSDDDYDSVLADSDTDIENHCFSPPVTNIETFTTGRSVKVDSKDRNICVSSKDDNEHDSDCSNELTSADTGRGSSLAFSDGEKCLNSPDYFLNHSPINAHNGKEKTICIDVATSPIHPSQDVPSLTSQYETIQIVLSPVNTEVEEANDLIKSEQTLCMSDGNEMVTPTAGESLDILNNEEQIKQILTDEALTPLEVCHKEVCDEEVCDEEVCDEEVCDEEVRDKEVCDEEVYDEEICNEEICDENSNFDVISSSPVCFDQDTEAPGVRQVNSETFIQQEYLESNRYEHFDETNAGDCEIEMILNNMRFNRTLITPIPSTPSKSRNTSAVRDRSSILSHREENVCIDAAKVRQQNKILEEKYNKLEQEIILIKDLLKTKFTSDVIQSNHESEINKELNKDIHIQNVEKNNTPNKFLPPVKQDKVSEDIDIPIHFTNKSIVVTAQSNESVSIPMLNPSLRLQLEDSDSDHIEYGEASTIIDEKNYEKTPGNVICQESSTELVSRNKKRKISKLERLRSKLAPKGKIKRSTTPAVSKKRLKPKLVSTYKKRVMETDHAKVLDNKSAYEKAVQIMLQLKSEQKSVSTKRHNPSKMTKTKMVINKNEISENIEKSNYIHNNDIKKVNEKDIQIRSNENVSVTTETNIFTGQNVTSENMETEDNRIDEILNNNNTKVIDNAVQTTAELKSPNMSVESKSQHSSNTTESNMLTSQNELPNNIQREDHNDETLNSSDKEPTVQTIGELNSQKSNIIKQNSFNKTSDKNMFISQNANSMNINRKDYYEETINNKHLKENPVQRRQDIKSKKHSIKTMERNLTKTSENNVFTGQNEISETTIVSEIINNDHINNIDKETSDQPVVGPKSQPKEKTDQAIVKLKTQPKFGKIKEHVPNKETETNLYKVQNENSSNILILDYNEETLKNKKPVQKSPEFKFEKNSIKTIEENLCNTTETYIFTGQNKKLENIEVSNDETINGTAKAKIYQPKTKLKYQQKAGKRKEHVSSKTNETNISTDQNRKNTQSDRIDKLINNTEVNNKNVHIRSPKQPNLSKAIETNICRSQNQISKNMEFNQIEHNTTENLGHCTKELVVAVVKCDKFPNRLTSLSPSPKKNITKCVNKNVEELSSTENKCPESENNVQNSLAEENTVIPKKITADDVRQGTRKRQKRESIENQDVPCKRILRSSNLGRSSISEEQTVANTDDGSKKDFTEITKLNNKNVSTLLFSPNKRELNYSDLDMFDEDTCTKPTNLEIEQDNVDSNDAILCVMLDKYGKQSSKKYSKKVSDSAISALNKTLQDGISGVTELNSNEAKQAMIKLVGAIQSWDHKIFRASLMLYLKDPQRKVELFNKINSPPAPPMTKSEQILLYIISQLKVSWPSIDVLNEVLFNIEYELFKLNRTPDFDVIESMSHFYAVLCRYFKLKSRLRLFMLDAMYCIQFKAVPLIKQCLEVWMHVLPLAHMGIAKSPLVTCMVYLLHFYKCEDRFNRVQEIRGILSRKYFYEITEWNEPRIIEMFRNAIKDLRVVSVEMKLLRLALIVIAKRHGPKWCQKNIIQNLLMPLLEKDVHEKIRIFCISMLGPLLKPYPADMKVHCEIVFNILQDILKDNPPPHMQEAIMTSLIYMGKHNQNRLLQILLSWKPQRISLNMENVFKDFVEEKPLKVWKVILYKMQLAQ